MKIATEIITQEENGVVVAVHHPAIASYSRTVRPRAEKHRREIDPSPLPYSSEAYLKDSQYAGTVPDAPCITVISYSTSEGPADTYLREGAAIVAARTGYTIMSTKEWNV